jgi:hypothetical protein
MINALSAITAIEEFCINVLLSSPDIPLDVNILRLADASETEGTVMFPRSITVRFTGSSTNATNKQPLIVRRTLNFELEISCQSHQNRSGHDYAIYLMGACAKALFNKVPINTGLAIVSPFTLESESFGGLTESSHFIYKQTWSLEVEETFPSQSTDPCVARGLCAEYSWDEGAGDSTVGEGEVIGTPNKIYHLKPPEPLDCVQFGGTVLNSNGDLVTVWDNDLVYLTKEQRDAGFTFIIKELEDTTDILVTVRGTDGIIIRSDIFCFTGRTILGLYLFQTNRGKSPEKIVSIFLPYAQAAVIFRNDGLLFKDPTDPNELPLTMKYGNLIYVDPNITLSVGDAEYVRSYEPRGGLSWVTQGSFRSISEVFLCDEQN